MSTGKETSQGTAFSGSRFVRKYITWIFLLMALAVSAIFWRFHAKAVSMFEEQIHAQGRDLVREILLTREWFAIHSGVYVRMTPGMEVNPWLRKIPGLKPVIRDREGVLYTLKNPALATREISDIAEKKGGFRFRITSLNPLNPFECAGSIRADPLWRSSQRGTRNRRYTIHRKRRFPTGTWCRSKRTDPVCRATRPKATRRETSAAGSASQPTSPRCSGR